MGVIRMGMAGLEGLLRKGMPLGLVAALGCTGNRDSEQPNDTGRDSSYTDDSGETGDSDTDSGTNLTYNAPQITSSLSATAYVDQEFTYTLTASQDATGTGGSLSCSFHAPFDFQQNGCTITYTPNITDLDMGPYNVDMEVSDENGEDEATLELTIAESTGSNAPVISTTSLASGTTNTAYSSSISATDADGDTLTYSLTEAPSWLSINSSTGALSGTPTSSATETVEVKVSDAGGLYDTASYSLLVASVAAVDIYVINGDSGAAADSSCSIDVTLTNSTSGYSSTVTMDASGVAAFSLDEEGLYNISVPSTNTGSNCYGGVSLDEWIDVSAGTNSGWVTLIPETYADEVASVVGSQIDMGDISGHASGDVDSVTKLVKYMSGIRSVSPY